MVEKQHLVKSEAGFSLIEVLVSTLILSLTIYMASVSCSIFLKIWGEKKFASYQNMHDYRKRALFRNSVESALDYFVEFGNSENRTVYCPFFKGTPDSITFVTFSSMFKSNKPAVASVIFEKKKDSTLSVIYREAFFDESYLAHYDDKIIFEKSVLLYEGLDDVKIRYYGLWKREIIDDSGSFRTLYKWQDEFDGSEKKRIPQIIEITLEGDNISRKLNIPVRNNNPIKNAINNPPFEVN